MNILYRFRKVLVIILVFALSNSSFAGKLASQFAMTPYKDNGKATFVKRDNK